MKREPSSIGVEGAKSGWITFGWEEKEVIDNVYRSAKFLEVVSIGPQPQLHRLARFRLKEGLA